MSAHGATAESAQFTDADLLVEFELAMLSYGWSPRTIKGRLREVPLAGRRCGVPAEQMTTTDCMRFLASASSPNTRAVYYSTLRAWFRWLRTAGYRDDNPLADIPVPRVPPTEPRTITTAHLQRLIGARMKARTRTMILLGAYQGMRASEIAGMRGTMIDPDAGELTIDGKGGRRRILPVHPVIAEEADKYGLGPWFPNRTNPTKPIRPISVTITISDAMKRAGIDGTAHDLRRWYATTLVGAGAPLTVVQRLLGHSNLNTTQKYVMVDTESRAAAVALLPDVSGSARHARNLVYGMPDVE